MNSEWVEVRVGLVGELFSGVVGQKHSKEVEELLAWY